MHIHECDSTVKVAAVEEVLGCCILNIGFSKLESAADSPVEELSWTFSTSDGNLSSCSRP